MASIFTQIVNGDIPSHKIYEDELTLAFLDIHPAQPGHTLVIPKKEIDHLWDLPDADYQAVMATSKKVASHLRKVLGVARVGVAVIGTDVPHAHVQLIPFNHPQEFYVHPDMNAEPDHDALAKMAQKLAIKE